MRRSVWIVCVLVAMALPMLASAGEWHRVDSAPSSAAPAEIVTSWLASPQSASLEVAGLELEVERVLPVGTASTVRLRQTHGGLPVLGAAAAVHVTADGRVSVANLDLARKLDVDTTPAISLERAFEVVATTGAPLALPMHDGARGELAVMPDADHGALVWQIVVPTSDGGWRYLVDAHDARLVGVHPMARHANGRVYPISATVTPQVDDLELLALDTTDPQVLRGWGNRFNVTNYVSGSPENNNLVVAQTVQGDLNGDFLFDPPANPNDPGDAFAQVSTYYHLSRMRQYFVDAHGLDTTGAEWGLTAVANLTQNGQPLDNAYYSPQGITGDFAAPNMIGIGQGTIDFAYDSDVIMHEFTHYITGVAVGYNQGQFFANQWGLQTAGGSIDEGVSDYFAATVNGDPIISEMALGALGASRNLEATNRVCPDDVFGEVHADGEIIGAYAWSVREALGAEVADPLIWGSISLLTSDATLGDLPRGALLIAENLVVEGSMTAVQRDMLAALAAPRGLDQCDQSLPLSPEEPHRITLIGLDFLAAAFGATCAQVKDFLGVELQSPFHFHVDPPADALGVRFHVELGPTAPGDLEYKLYGRTNEHVTFRQGSFAPEVDVYDYRVINQTGTSAELVIDASSTPPFDPAATYHFVVMQANCPTSFTDVSVEYILEPVPPEDIADVADTADVADSGGDTSPSDTDPGTDTTPGEDTAPDTSGEDTSAPADTDPGTDTGAELVEDETTKSSDDCACQVRADAGDSDTPRPLFFGALAALFGLLTLRRRR